MALIQAAITSEATVKKYFTIRLKTLKQQRSRTTSGIRNTESAKVFDMEGKEIPKGSKIMGGKELTDSPLDDLKSIVDDYKPMGDQPPPGSRGGADDIAAPVQSSEEIIEKT